jgi:hypothetical protein
VALNQEDEIALTLGYIVQLSQESLVVPIQLIFSEHGKVSLVIERGRGASSSLRTFEKRCQSML